MVSLQQETTALHNGAEGTAWHSASAVRSPHPPSMWLDPSLFSALCDAS